MRQTVLKGSTRPSSEGPNNTKEYRMSTRTWQDNAEEFGAIIKQGVDVRLAVLVACSVTKAPGRVAAATLEPKTNATGFAKGAGSTATRVLRHLVAWDACAILGYCKPSADLTPNDVNGTDCPTQEQFDKVWQDNEVGEAAGSRPRDSKPEHAVQIIEKRGAAAIVEQMTPEVRKDMLTEITKQEEIDRDLETISRGGTPPNREALTTRDPSALDIMGDQAQARVKAEAALKAILPALREVGTIPADSPLADLVRTTAMEMVDMIVSTDVTR